MEKRDPLITSLEVLLMSHHTPLEIIGQALALLREEGSILASPEDALYFRQTFKKAEAKEIAVPAVRQTSLPKRIEPTPLPAPPKPVEEVPPQKAPFRSEVEKTIEPVNFQALKILFQRFFPQVAVLDLIPNDALAKRMAYRWKTKNQVAPISILFLSEPPKQKELLSEIVRAIDVYFGPARFVNAEAIEKENQWETFLGSPELKWVIVCDYTLWQLSSLMRHYKEMPSQQLRFLGTTPLFLLPDLSLYLKDPLLKRSLWKSLCLKLST